ncbi:ion transporter [Pseudobacteriovorax antillogorgiicola]|uniref:Voltage-gated potassium channel n=1 Tax=Pseudobacteriovorax antillogorgiicola TaxID=1513793 RepID=A0A1Y6BH08_9BACT|nr:ion transporter [Pseudobacteriovorax antillogorgiicola]TCS57286.1 voltage-gated potassium channel [Pseudobacteriovorax antillogorgiicola]SMF03063.1 voltage-gated potassium channel [Pseudobacteriovorax antillogorgiicola]
MTKLQSRLYDLIFEAETRDGRRFDLILIAVIVSSVVVVALDSVASLNESYSMLFLGLEWLFTVAFTIEYLTRIYCFPKRWKYIFSFYGIIDLLSILPTYMSLIFVGTHSFAVIRAIRLLRVFRILKLAQFVSQQQILSQALRDSRAKITVFILAILPIVLIVGTIMYLVEGETNGFTSIPRSMYWAIVTMTTVGYGDIAPQTIFGQFLASIVMVLGYGILAVPTGIVSVHLSHAILKSQSNTETCPSCALEGHADDASFCRRCGSPLELA